MANATKVLVSVIFLIVMAGISVPAQTQTAPGAGNADAAMLSRKSPVVQSAYTSLRDQAKHILDQKMRNETLDAITNPQTCIRHRAHLTEAHKDRILKNLIDAGLLDAHDDATFPGGLKAGVFPPVINDGGDCPQLPQPFYAAPGSFFGGHHSYPGGLVMHEMYNSLVAADMARHYQQLYGFPGHITKASGGISAGLYHAPLINNNIIAAAPIWHDWAKTIVFQWNKDGTEFQELELGGNGATDNNNHAGNSRTGSHHILGLAETMERGLGPDLVITQACAHSAPTTENEFKVVNWLRAAATIARIDPVERGYLSRDPHGHFRLPAVRKLADVNFSQVNVLAEYTIHNLSDGDFIFSVPAVKAVDEMLRQLAPEFGFGPADTASYNNLFRNPVLSFSTAERLMMIYSNQGIEGVRAAIQDLRKRKVI